VTALTGATYRSGVDAAQLSSGFRVRHLTTTSSTNTVALEAAVAGEPEGLVVVADHQTAGRGRLGRTWSAPAGTALLVSVLLRPPPPLMHPAVTAVGCAAAAACTRVSGREPRLKWPNDLVVDDRKLAGVLAETTANMAAVVVGLGLNVNRPTDRPEELTTIAIDLEDLAGSTIDRDELLDVVLEELRARYDHLISDGPDDLLAEYRARCVTIGQQVSVTQPNGVLEGRAVGVSSSGALELEQRQGGRVTVEIGDVVHVRPV
jgi:BirA family transcriptional regulator, biotin operon repressor / biotin---[acetyl-CoA-carboxylase] ligase